MSHVAANKKPLITRVRRIRGQIDALERALEEDAECADILTQVAAVRGASQALMVEVLGDHLREHVAAPVDEATRHAEMAQVMAILKSYFR